MKNLTKRVPN